ncbi:MAG: polyprenyl synthetase family protein, partial [Chloroflexota bacterium]
AMLDLAHHQVATPVVLQALAKLMESSLAMLEGQYLDLEFEQRLDVTPQEYQDMISLKTGALIACSMEMGGLVGSEDPSTVSLFLQSGLHIGQLFQLRDDVLGIWGDSATTGKPMHSDIHRKKKTFPVVYAFQHATGAGAKTLRRLYQKEQLHRDDVRQVVEVLEATGARQEAHRRASTLADQALESLRPAELSARSRRDMEDLVSFLLYREQ